MNQPILKPYIVDAHEDLAWNMLTFGRDYSESAYRTRQKEAGSQISIWSGDTMSGWPEYQKGHIGIIFGTLYATPKKRQEGDWEQSSVYADADQAHSIYWRELEIYNRFIDSHPDQFNWIRSQTDLADVLKRQTEWDAACEAGKVDLPPAPVGMVLLMEGAEGVRHPSELEEWWEAGLRVIGPAWAGTRFCGGTREPGPLTALGRELLEAMDDLHFTLDISHMDSAAVLQALDMYQSPIICSHTAPEKFLTSVHSNRFLSDEIIRKLVERDGVIGLTAYNLFLSDRWKKGDPRDQVSIHACIDQIDYICQLAGDAKHVGMGSDFDGGFGYQSTPPELEDISDLQKLVPLLFERGYTELDIRSIMGMNWLSYLRKGLPYK